MHRPRELNAYDQPVAWTRVQVHAWPVEASQFLDLGLGKRPRSVGYPSVLSARPPFSMQAPVRESHEISCALASVRMNFCSRHRNKLETTPLAGCFQAVWYQQDTVCERGFRWALLFTASGDVLKSQEMYAAILRTQLMMGRLHISKPSKWYSRTVSTIQI